MTELPLALDAAALRDRLGAEIGVSEWLTVTQERIDQFADAIDDHQWLHVDPARAARESPFGGTIAHGFLTLSLLTRLLAGVVSIEGFHMGVNYGLNRVRFTAPITAGARVRGRFTLAALRGDSEFLEMIWNVLVEVEGQDKPCLAAEWITRRYR